MLALFLSLLAGCAHYPSNPPVAHYDGTAGYRFGNCTAAGGGDETFIVLAFSGGGTRAAAFSFGVLEELHRTRVDSVAARDGQPLTLLDDVDLISSVSGGSFTAAYYSLFREKIFTDPEYQNRFLYHNVQGDLLLRLLNPINLYRLASPNFSRIDLAAEYYDQKLFHHQTFAKLAEDHARPFMMINATDMSPGARFEFTQNQFDLLMSDLNGVPVARAVAASSAFPFLLCPLTLQNYPKQGYGQPKWVPVALENDFENSPRRWARANVVRSYFDPQRRYLHLMDGGIADNVGLRGPIAALRFPDMLDLDDGGPRRPSRDLNIERLIADNRIRRLVFIIADAKPGASNDRDRSGTTPGIFDVGVTTASAPMGNYSFDTVQLLREECDLLEKEHGGDGLQKVKTYVIHLRFDGVQDEATRRYLQGLGTNFQLPAKAVDTLRATGAQLLRESSVFQKLVKDLQ